MLYMRYILLAPLIAGLIAGCTTGASSAAEQDVASIVAERDNVVRYTDDGFAPRHIQVGPGERVTWVSDGPAMWVASSSHPTHADYGLDDHADPLFDQGAAGQVYTFRFNRTGEWQYHNHENAYHYGTVTVTGE